MWVVCVLVGVALSAAQAELPGVPIATDVKNGTGAAAVPVAADPTDGADGGGVVIKTWGFLRDTTDALGTRAQDVLRVRQDLKDMETDINAQRVAWQAAAQDMRNSNQMLKQQLAQLGTMDNGQADQQVAQLETQLEMVNASVRTARINQTAARLAAEGKAQAHVAQVSALHDRIRQVNTELMESKEHHLQAMNDVTQTKNDLQAQIVQLRQEVDALKVDNKALDSQGRHNVTMLQDQQAFLAKQGQAVAADLPKVQATANQSEPVQQAMTSQEQDLAQVQAELADAQGRCDQHTRELQGVLQSEQTKVGMRTAAVARCASVHAQNTYLQQQVSQKCSSSSAFGR